MPVSKPIAPGLFHAPEVRLVPVHLVRAGAGLDAVKVQVSGVGLLWGLGRVRWVRGSFDAVLLRRFPGQRLRLWFLGPGGFRRASADLAPLHALAAPSVPACTAPAPPTVMLPEAPTIHVPRAWVRVDVEPPQVPSPPYANAPVVREDGHGS